MFEKDKNAFWVLLLLYLSMGKIDPVTLDTNIENELDVTLCSNYYKKEENGISKHICRKTNDECVNCINKVKCDFNNWLEEIKKEYPSEIVRFETFNKKISELMKGDNENGV